MQKFNKILFAIILVGLGIASRTIWHLGENVEFVTASTLLAGAYLGFGWSIIVPLMIMVTTDLMIGNTNIFLFTWSGYLFISSLGYLSHLRDFKKGKRILRAAGIGVVASFWFYLWTNFGVWFLDSFGMYPKTFSGLMESYYFGLPFLKLNLLGNLLFVFLSFTSVEMLTLKLKSPVSPAGRQKSKLII